MLLTKQNPMNPLSIEATSLVLFVLISLPWLTIGQSRPQLDYILYLKQTYGKNLTTFAKEIGLIHFEQNFTDFLKEHNKEYFGDEEIQYRKTNFLYSLKLVQDNNRDFESGRVSYRLKLNKFADYGLNENFLISQKAITARYFGSKQQPPNYGENYKKSNTTFPVFPINFDWRSKGIVTPVEDQQMCGSCWIFASISTIESANALAKNPLVVLSKQQILDCATPPQYISDGCSGGTAEDVYRFVQRYGVVTDKIYPYTGKAGNCKNMNKEWKEWISSYYFLPINSTDEEIMWVIYNKGPVATIINAGDRHFQLYEGGVLTVGGDRDLTGDTNHYVVIVGWGIQNGYNYWLVKNSWGPHWGEEGYVKMSRGNNNRGMNTLVSFSEAKQQKQNFPNQTNSTANYRTTLPHTDIPMIIIIVALITIVNIQFNFRF